MKVDSPQLMQAIPALQANENLPINVLNLRDYIQNKNTDDGEIRFVAMLADGKPLPNGCVCAETGIFTGVPRPGTYQAEPYSILVIARNASDIPLVVYFDLTIHPSKLTATKETVTVTETTADTSVDTQLNEFLALLKSDEVLAKVVQEESFSAKLSHLLDDPQYCEMFIRYLVHKYSPMQLFHLGKSSTSHAAYQRQVAKTGWPILMNDSVLTTMNPDAVSITFSRTPLIETFREMITLAIAKGFKQVSVSGADSLLGIVLLREHNTSQMNLPAEEQWIFDINEAQDHSWALDAITQFNAGR